MYLDKKICLPLMLRESQGQNIFHQVNRVFPSVVTIDGTILSSSCLGKQSLY